MSEKLYHCVAVHGKQGINGPIKAYACSNCMEFFAELSVAYLYHMDSNSITGDLLGGKLSEDCEFNKWFPHNRKQLLCYDAATFAIMKAIWRNES